MLTEAALMPKNLSSRVFFSCVIPFSGYGSAKAKSYGSSGSGSATLPRLSFWYWAAPPPSKQTLLFYPKCWNCFLQFKGRGIEDPFKQHKKIEAICMRIEETGKIGTTFDPPLFWRNNVISLITRSTVKFFKISCQNTIWCSYFRHKKSEEPVNENSIGKYCTVHYLPSRLRSALIYRNADPDPAFFLVADPDPDPVLDPGFWWPKIGKKFKI